MISINRARNTVLFLLDKNNRGFISPEKFDTFCYLAQMDIFENLFFQYNKWKLNENKHLSTTEYGDIPNNIQEQIDAFSMYSTDVNFTYNDVTNVWSFTGTDLYRAEGLSLVFPNSKKIDVEKVLKGPELNNLINSKINMPTTTYPIYTKIGSGFRVFPKVPTTPTGYSLELFYIRTPKTPKWSYINVDGNPMYNSGALDKQDIELDESLFAEFIIKVLSYCGLSIKEQDVVAVAANAEVVTDQKQS
jgi:hypothetical protein